MKNSDLLLKQLDEILERKKDRRRSQVRDQKKPPPLSEAPARSEQASFSLADPQPNPELLRSALTQAVDQVFERHADTAWIDALFASK